MTPEADAFLDELRARSGGGPDLAKAPTEMWKPREPKELRAVLDELERHGEIVFDTGIQDGNRTPRRRGMVCITLRGLQASPLIAPVSGYIRPSAG